MFKVREEIISEIDALTQIKDTFPDLVTIISDDWFEKEINKFENNRVAHPLIFEGILRPVSQSILITLMKNISEYVNYIMKHKDKPGWIEWIKELNNRGQRQSYHAMSELGIAYVLEKHGWSLIRFKKPTKYSVIKCDIDLVMSKEDKIWNIQVKNPEGDFEPLFADVKKTLQPVLKKYFKGYNLLIDLELKFQTEKLNDVIKEIKSSQKLPFTGEGIQILQVSKLHRDDLFELSLGGGGGISNELDDKASDAGKQLPMEISRCEYNVCAIVLPISTPRHKSAQFTRRSNIDLILLLYNGELMYDELTYSQRIRESGTIDNIKQRNVL